MPMDVRASAGVTDTRGFARAVRGLQDFWRLALPRLSVLQAAIVDTAIKPTYRQRLIEPADPATYGRRPPTTADFVRAITVGYAQHSTRGGGARELIERLRRLIHGPLAEVFDRLTTGALDRHCTVFDLRDPRAAQPDNPRLVAQVILQQLASRPPRPRRGRVVVIDEVWPLLRAHRALPCCASSPRRPTPLRRPCCWGPATSATSSSIPEPRQSSRPATQSCCSPSMCGTRGLSAWARDLRYPHPETFPDRVDGLRVFGDIV